MIKTPQERMKDAEDVIKLADAYARAYKDGMTGAVSGKREALKAKLRAMLEVDNREPRVMPSCPAGCRDGDHADGCVYGEGVDSARVARAATAGTRMGAAIRASEACTCGDGRLDPPRRFASHADDCPARDHPPAGPPPTPIPVHPLEHLHPGEPGLAEPLVQRVGETEEEFGERKAKWEAKRAEERKTEAERRGRDDAERERRAEARRLAVFGRVSHDEPPPIRRGPAIGEIYRDGKRIA